MYYKWRKKLIRCTQHIFRYKKLSDEVAATFPKSTYTTPRAAKIYYEYYRLILRHAKRRPRT